MRAEDEPELPPSIHHWLAKLDQEVSGLRSGMNDLTRDLNELRVEQAGARSPNWSVVMSLAGVILALGVQTAYAVYWGGGIAARLDQAMSTAQHTAAVMEEHVRTAGPFRAGMEQTLRDVQDLDTRLRLCAERQAVNIQRVEAIEARNKIADQNWDLLKRKGMLVESTR